MDEAFECGASDGQAVSAEQSGTMRAVLRELLVCNWRCIDAARSRCHLFEADGLCWLLVEGEDKPDAKAGDPHRIDVLQPTTWSLVAACPEHSAPLLRLAAGPLRALCAGATFASGNLVAVVAASRSLVTAPASTAGPVRADRAVGSPACIQSRRLEAALAMTATRVQALLERSPQKRGRVRTRLIGPGLPPRAAETCVATLVSGPAVHADFCAACARTSSHALRKCARCREVAYCTPACQRKHWRVHKVFCKPLSSSVAPFLWKTVTTLAVSPTHGALAPLISRVSSAPASADDTGESKAQIGARFLYMPEDGTGPSLSGAQSLREQLVAAMAHCIGAVPQMVCAQRLRPEVTPPCWLVWIGESWQRATNSGADKDATRDEDKTEDKGEDKDEDKVEDKAKDKERRRALELLMTPQRLAETEQFNVALRRLAVRELPALCAEVDPARTAVLVMACGAVDGAGGHHNAALALALDHEATLIGDAGPMRRCRLISDVPSDVFAQYFCDVLQPSPKVSELCLGCKRRLGAQRPKLCSRCRTASYCSPECQRSHWPTHKSVCQPPTTVSPPTPSSLSSSS